MNHLVIYNKNLFGYDYIASILNGSKTVGMKFRAKRTAPYQKLCNGDYLYLKESSGPIRGRVRVNHVINRELLQPEEVMEFLANHAHGIGIISEGQLLDIWRQNMAKRYLCYWELEMPEALQFPIYIQKRDRRSWISEYRPSEEVSIAFL